jgi:hypothetical protein
MTNNKQRIIADLELLKCIAEYEDSLAPDTFKAMAGWRPYDVGIWPAKVAKLRMEGEGGYGA